MKPAPGKAVLYVISDSTGNLARHMVSAYLTQFPPSALEVRFEPFVCTERRLEDVLSGARAERAAVCHAVVSPVLKRAIVESCKRSRTRCHDLTSAGVKFLERVADAAPRADVAALHKIDTAYRRRIGAMEFTIAHDDGMGLETIGEADVVLTGVSRTSKTPTSILLAQQGYAVANVSLAAGVDPPTELLAMPAAKVVAFLISPEQLHLIRLRRQAAWRMARTDYGDPDRVAEEVEWSRRLFAKRRWRVLDVTDQAVEETAARVLQLLNLRQPSTDGAASSPSCLDLPAV